MQKGDAPMPHQMDYATVEMDYLNHRYCTPQWSIEPVHTHFIDISYIIEGSATYYIDGHAYEVKAGDLLCIPKGCLREAHVHPDDLMECFCLNFLLTDTRTGDDLSLPFPLISQIGVRHSLIRLFNSVYQAWLLKEDGYIMKTRAYTLLILSELFSMLRYDHHVSNADARVRRAVSYITDHLNEPLSVPLLAEQAQLNPVYFCSLFRQSVHPPRSHQSCGNAARGGGLQHHRNCGALRLWGCVLFQPHFQAAKGRSPQRGGKRGCP